MQTSPSGQKYQTRDLRKILERVVGYIWSEPGPEGTRRAAPCARACRQLRRRRLQRGRAVGVSIAFFGQEGDHFHLHSHITGVDPRRQNKSLGFALKQFQRSWALARGTASIRWTADPLVRRNLYFNLCKLGATIVDYYPDFYGPLLDGVNGDGASDRVLLNWELASSRAVEAAEQPPLEAVLRPRSGRRLPRQRRLSGRHAVSRRHASRLDPRRHRQPPEQRSRSGGRVARSGSGRSRQRGRGRIPGRGDHARRLAPPEPMKIEAVELRRIAMPLVAPFRTSFGTETDRDILLVRVVAGDAEGWGECVAMADPLYSLGVRRRRRRRDPPFPAAAALARPATSTRRRGRAGARARSRATAMAKAALEMAVLDAELRAAGVSFGARPRRGPRPGRRAGSRSASWTSIPRAARRRRRLPRRGLRAHQAEDRAGLGRRAGARRARAASATILLQVDANTAYTPRRRPAPGQARRRSTCCSSSSRCRGRHARPRRAGARCVRTPICLDESITSARSAADAIALGACRDRQHQAGPGRRLPRGAPDARRLRGARRPGVVRRHARDRARSGRQRRAGRAARLHAARATPPPPTATTHRTSPSPSSSATGSSPFRPDPASA